MYLTMMISIYSSVEGTDPTMPRSIAIGSLAIAVQEKKKIYIYIYIYILVLTQFT